MNRFIAKELRRGDVIVRRSLAWGAATYLTTESWFVKSTNAWHVSWIKFPCLQGVGVHTVDLTNAELPFFADPENAHFVRRGCA